MKNLLLCFCSLTAAFSAHSQFNPHSELLLRAQTFRLAEWDSLVYTSSAFTGLGPLKEPVYSGKDTLYFTSDNTFAYPFILEIHTEEGRVNIVTFPFNNMNNHGSKKLAEEVFSVDSTGAWNVHLHVRHDWQMESHYLEVPERGSKEVFVYSFASEDKGVTWKIDRNIRKED